MPRERENKNYCSVSFQPDAKLKIKKKIAKTYKNFKNTHYGFILSQNRLEKDEKEGNKNYHYVSFQPDA